MKRNLYYRTVHKRSNRIKEFFLGLFSAISSGPRLLLEVFIRRNFGERYFSFSGAIILTFILALLPIAAAFGFNILLNWLGGGEAYTGGTFLLRYLTWYVFLAAFMYMAIQRRNEIKRLPSVFDMERYSLSTGVIHPAFGNVIIRGKKVDTRVIETLLEPLFFFTIGAVLWVFGQAVGILIISCSIIYSLSYVADYRTGDHFVMDKIDEMILNKALVKAFVDGKDGDQTKGFRFYGRRPADPDIRREVVESFFDYEETVEAV